MRLGVEPLLVDSGANALEELNSQSYDLIFMDCQMPGMDGFETTAAIRDRETSTNTHSIVVALTANAMASDRKRCLDSGMDDYLPKPVSINSLEACLERWISQPNHKPTLPLE